MAKPIKKEAVIETIRRVKKCCAAPEIHARLQAMKILLLLFTFTFSFSVLADCCNVEVESANEHCQSVGQSHDHCDDDGEKDAAPEHCHCAPSCRLRFHSSVKVAVALPSSFSLEHTFSSDLPTTSSYESSVFHPPIA